MKYFNCYIINLPQDKDKKRHILKVVKRNGIKPVFISAIYGYDLKDSDISNIYSEERTQGNIGRSLTKGEIGCALSHLSVYKSMVANDVPLALILEDDIDFDCSYEQLCSLVQKFPSDWECVLVGHHSRISRSEEGIASFRGRIRVSKHHSIVRFVDRPAGGYAYFISQKGAEKWLREFEVITAPTDYWESRKINLYGISPAIVKISSDYEFGSMLDIERQNQSINMVKTKKNRSIFIKILALSGFIKVYFLCKNLPLKFKLEKPYQ